MKQGGILSAQDIVLFGWHIYMPMLRVAGMYKGASRLVHSSVVLGDVIPDKKQSSLHVSWLSAVMCYEYFCFIMWITAFCPTCACMV
jgi:hypothetical protein